MASTRHQPITPTSWATPAGGPAEDDDSMEEKKPVLAPPGPATVLQTILPVSSVSGLAVQSVSSHDAGGRGVGGGQKTAAALIFNHGECNSLVYQAALTIASLDQRVLVVLGGGSWSSLPPSTHSMPPASPSIMRNISFLYPHNLQELIQYVAKLPGTNNPSLPQSVVVGNIEKLISNSMSSCSDAASVGPSRQLSLMAKISAVLTDFVDHCASKNSESVHPSRLLVTAQFDNWTNKLVQERASLWYPEVWELSRSDTDLVTFSEMNYQLVCKSSTNPISVNFYESQRQMFLHSITGIYS